MLLLLSETALGENPDNFIDRPLWGITYRHFWNWKPHHTLKML